MQLRLALKSLCSLGLEFMVILLLQLSAGITSMHHHTWLLVVSLKLFYFSVYLFLQYWGLTLVFFWWGGGGRARFQESNSGPHA